MKKAIVLILIVALGLCACGAPAPSAEHDRGEAAAPAGKAEEPAAAQEAPEAVSAAEPAGDGSPVTEVQITPENYREYFEVLDKIDYEEKDDKGNVIYQGVATVLQLRGKYQLADSPTVDPTITIRYEYDNVITDFSGKCAIDFSTWEGSGDSKEENRTRESVSTTFTGDSFNLAYSVASLDQTMGYAVISRCSDLHITDISGILTIQNG